MIILYTIYYNYISKFFSLTKHATSYTIAADIHRPISIMCKVLSLIVMSLHFKLAPPCNVFKLKGTFLISARGLSPREFVYSYSKISTKG